MLFLMPFVMIANLANERRAATAALAIAVPVALALCYIAFPQRRKFVGGLVAGTIIAVAIYLPAFWNSSGVLAQPARAIRSNFEPSERDQSSDIYRIDEDANLMYTMRISPIIGYGYGKPIFNTNNMVDVSDFDSLVMYLTHDQILWVWMRLGVIGFIVFWIMIANILIRAANTAADLKFDKQDRAIGVFVATTVAMLLLFGLYDLQLSNVRDMLFSSVWIGVLGAVLRRRAEQEESARIKRLSAIGRHLYPRSINAIGYSYMPYRPRMIRGASQLVRIRPSQR
jgi:O-antigen ligase